jgi:hypothetical protein
MPRFFKVLVQFIDFSMVGSDDSSYGTSNLVYTQMQMKFQKQP